VTIQWTTRRMLLASEHFKGDCLDDYSNESSNPRTKGKTCFYLVMRTTVPWYAKVSTISKIFVCFACANKKASETAWSDASKAEYIWHPHTIPKVGSLRQVQHIIMTDISKLQGQNDIWQVCWPSYWFIVQDIQGKEDCLWQVCQPSCVQAPRSGPQTTNSCS
jgi:hypothetical protein